jgi:hypothetical protein
MDIVLRKNERIEALEKDIARLTKENKEMKAIIDSAPWSTAPPDAPIHDVAAEIEDIVDGTPGTWGYKIRTMMIELDRLTKSRKRFGILYHAIFDETFKSPTHAKKFKKWWRLALLKEVVYQYIHLEDSA